MEIREMYFLSKRKSGNITVSEETPNVTIVSEEVPIVFKETPMVYRMIDMENNHFHAGCGSEDSEVDEECEECEECEEGGFLVRVEAGILLKVAVCKE